MKETDEEDWKKMTIQQWIIAKSTAVKSKQ